LVEPEARDRLAVELACPTELVAAPGCAPNPAAVAMVSALVANVLRFEGGVAVVDVWTVAVTAASVESLAAAAWSTQRIELVWTTGDGWLVRSYASRPGPVPMTPQAPSRLTAATHG
jgi:hypothetical protein